ncbi:MAG: creatininase family protein [Deltaproteobacteria bacterium]|nr:creatininase family protein [Deltaproteobacteria bacterium]
MSQKPYNIIDCSMVDVKEWIEEMDIVLIPIGSCEQHGPHLPLGTDSITAEVITERAAKKANVPHTPLIWCGYSPQHMRNPNSGAGTITLRSTTFNALLYDIGRSLIHHGFNKIVYVTGHGSNIKVLDPMLRNLRYETGAFIAMYKAYSERDLTLVEDIVENPKEETPGWHCSEMETAQDMAYNMNLVRMDRAVKEFVHAPKWMGNAFNKVDGSAGVTFQGQEYIVVPMEHHEYSDSGVVGNPFRATPEKGEKLFERFASYLADFLNELKKIKVEVYNRPFTCRA